MIDFDVDLFVFFVDLDIFDFDGSFIGNLVNSGFGILDFNNNIIVVIVVFF